jgi:hypothetical protein
MTAEAFLRERRSAAENGLTSEPQTDLLGNNIALNINERNKGVVAHRANALVAFRNILTSINEKSPWFIQTIDGLDSILKVTPPRQVGGGAGYKEQRSGILTFNCLDAIDLRVAAMGELYRKATYDFQYHREMLPANLRKFRMWIIVTEIRQIDLQKNLADVLNPFNISGVGSTFENIQNIAQSSGILKSRATNSGDDPRSSLKNFVDSFQKLTPYIMMYQLDLCEFNFDESLPFSNLNNANPGLNSQVSAKFKVHVGNVKEYKMQYNILSDLLKNESVFAPLLIQDSWNLNGSKIFTQGVTLDNNQKLFSNLANNFINNSVASVVQQQVSPIVTRQLLGNAYGFNISDAVRSLNSAQDLVSGINNMKTPFQDYKPQSKGLGGPGERQYPLVKDDVYKTVPENLQYGLGNQYPPGIPPPPGNPNDVYPTNPGVDLGLPQRMYPTNTDDQYANVPGTDLGVPTRIYPTTAGSDQYPTNPGVDLGLPQRTYPVNTGDEYNNVPGTDLGVPQRVYPTTAGIDQYPTNPGPNLGLPQRTYPVNTGDEYANVPGTDLGVPQRVYPTTAGTDLYPTNPGVDLGLPQRSYPVNTGDEYVDVPGQDLGVPGRVYMTPAGADTYPSNPGPDLGLPQRSYPVNTGDEYNDVPGQDLGVPQRVYPAPAAPDTYPSNPGPDLGSPDRMYPSVSSDEYKDVPGSDLGAPGRRYSSDTGPDVYPSIPGSDLGLPGRRYPSVYKDEYETVPGKDLGAPERSYPKTMYPDPDVYSNNPGKDLGLPNRIYPAAVYKDEYPGVPGTDLGVPGKEYPKTIFPNPDIYSSVPGSDLGLPDRDYPRSIENVYKK